MPEKVDATGLACPQPVVLTKKALEDHDQVIVIVDNETSRENVMRLGKREGCAVTVENRDDGSFQIALNREGAKSESAGAGAPGVAGTAGPTVFVIADNRMGRGDDELGTVLIKAFIHTIFDLDTLPDTLIFYNAGVKLTVKDSDVIDDLRELESRGVEILVCGTCTNFFQISEMVADGIISNMYDIAGTMARAGRIVMP